MQKKQIFQCNGLNMSHQKIYSDYIKSPMPVQIIPTKKM